MRRFGWICAAGIVAGGVFLSAVAAQQPAAMPEPRRGAGASITPAFEGWFYNADGSRSFLVGYYNRNAQQELDIPIGPNNRIEPGGPDLGQPTHFMTGRQWGMFVVPVPRDFKPTDSYSWTIVANGQSVTIPFRLHADYVMSPFTEIAVGNTPPVLRFEPNGKTFQGPLASLASAVTAKPATVGTPTALDIWFTDDLKYTSGTNAPPAAARQPVTTLLSKYRGPGKVTFEKPRPAIERQQTSAGFSGKTTAKVTFSDPGEYVLHVIGNDYSGDGGGGFGCCWTTALVKVDVK